jgi:hypothetical protein
MKAALKSPPDGRSLRRVVLEICMWCFTSLFFVLYKPSFLLGGLLTCNRALPTAANDFEGPSVRSPQRTNRKELILRDMSKDERGSFLASCNISGMSLTTEISGQSWWDEHSSWACRL